MKDQDKSTRDDLEMERLTCQMMALMRAKWPERYSKKRADLKVVAAQPEPRQAAMSDEEIRSQLLTYIRKTCPEEFAVESPDLEIVAFRENPDTRNLRVTVVDHKKRRDQLNARLDEKWGPVQEEIPKPQRVMVDHPKQLIRAKRTAEFACDKTNLVPFPRAKKRGAKVRTGPCAKIFPLPGIYIGNELDERFEFIRSKANDWDTTNTEGTQAVDWRRRAWIECSHEHRHKRPLTDRDKREQVKEGRAQITTRNRIKAYLERRGVDLAKIRNPEEALFALFGFVEAQP